MVLYPYEIYAVSKKFKTISDKYHNLSLLFYELSKSIEIEGRKKNSREFKKYLKDLNLDIKKILRISQSIKDIEFSDLEKD